MMVTTLPAIRTMKPGSAGPPLPGISVSVVDTDTDTDTDGEGDTRDSDAREGGYLVVDRPWPGMPAELCEGVRWAARARERTPGGSSGWAYPTEDSAKTDEDGYITILGRVDDVINVSGHRFGTMEIESAIVDVEGVAEAAVVSGDHDVHGKAIYAYASPTDGHDGNDRLRDAIVAAVEDSIGPIARPEAVVFTPEMPKTRSGKIMRRLLADIANDDELGDLSALRNPEVVGEIESTLDDG
jgi:acetyl-CoA synthetase